jgi:hypothetical protein
LLAWAEVRLNGDNLLYIIFAIMKMRMLTVAYGVDRANILQRSKLKELGSLSKFEEEPAGALPLQITRRKAGELHLE